MIVIFLQIYQGGAGRGRPLLQLPLGLLRAHLQRRDVLRGLSQRRGGEQGGHFNTVLTA